MYDEKHRFIQSNNPKFLLQKGIREKLLCHDCEQLLANTYESYGRKVLYGGEEIEILESPQGKFSYNLDYKKFKIFSLSLLWRASISTREMFDEFKLLSNAEEKLRNMILNGNAGETFNFPFYNYVVEEERFGFIMPPEKYKDNSHRIVRIIIGHFTWFFLISSHTEKFENKDILFKEDGILKVRKIKMSDTELIKQLNLELIQK
ncbi:MAG: hypothetical protein DWQ06_14180 [Calditrichaeota bacterium]|nr:MAG: hypothetical protein DWQ06_14180 [Calditrichota bacterium]